MDKDPFTLPELTASFVVIGTKKMFDTGYENYLPIERVITHPHYRGWTADLALVYTFAGMTSDKPGNVIPLVGEKTLTPVDSNVTVLSWGHCKDGEPSSHTRAPVSVDPEPICDPEEDNSCDDKVAGRAGRIIKIKGPRSADDSESEPTFVRAPGNSRPQVAPVEINHANYRSPHRDSPAKLMPADEYRRPAPREPIRMTTPSSRALSRYLPSKEKNYRIKKQNQKLTTQRHRYYKSNRNTKAEEDKSVMIVGTKGRRSKVKLIRRSGQGSQYVKKGLKEQKNRNETKIQSYFKNWRRQIGSTVNKLTVEIFGFVNVQACKRMVEKVLPAIYSINPNHVVCFATEEHYITDEDSGAPAINQGHLVAVTMGGVMCDGDHVAVGVKMSCFCTWIADNLPDGGENMRCCKDCCQGGDWDATKNLKQSKHKNKYLFT
ncbi:uncharacterized protein LOC113505875 isoform X3 [Trichoplusia ni]|uniref:Uncharacterized protein LOC113505875 isoform X3 n=1 Tax=Trichoplusia ni TaxID=7111 RepID=A0A7E5WUK5_TRINI|nr:uncharacterized protein LOC113505875 isoform X3 [Trichoplusia ni]